MVDVFRSNHCELKDGEMEKKDVEVSWPADSRSQACAKRQSNTEKLEEGATVE